jgi:hypothetical protein
MRYVVIRLVAISAILFFPAGNSETATAGFILNFDSLAQNDALEHDIGPVYSAGGFTLTASHFDPIANPASFDFFGTQSLFSPGRTALFHHISLGEISLTRTDGGAFDFYSIDLAELPGGDAFGNPVKSAPFGLTFFGTTAGGSTVSETITVDSFLTLKTYNLTGFYDVVEVHWFQGAGPTNDPPSPTHQFDNLELAAVPAPGTLTLACIGAFMLTGFGYLPARRHKNRHVHNASVEKPGG